jgi:hypothetical protein
MSSYFQENETKINSNLQQGEEPISKGVSEASQGPLTPLSESQQYNLPSNQNETQNRANFITLSKIPEDLKTCLHIRRIKLYQNLKE